jgi:hypothetical protein
MNGQATLVSELRQQLENLVLERQALQAQLAEAVSGNNTTSRARHATAATVATVVLENLKPLEEALKRGAGIAQQLKRGGDTQAALTAFEQAVRAAQSRAAATGSGTNALHAAAAAADTAMDVFLAQLSTANQELEAAGKQVGHRGRV